MIRILYIALQFLYSTCNHLYFRTSFVVKWRCLKCFPVYRRYNLPQLLSWWAHLNPRESKCFLVAQVKKVKVKWSRYRPGVAERVGRDIALLFHDRGTRRGWVVSSTPRLHFTPRKDLVPILQEAGWVPGRVWTGGNSRPHRDSIPGRPDCSQSLYRLSYLAHSVAQVELYK